MKRWVQSPAQLLKVKHGIPYLPVPVSPALGKWRQEGREFKVILSY